MDNLELAYQISAKIVQLYGDKYLPVFLRLHNEVAKARATQDQKEIALHVAEGYTTGG